MNFYNKFPTDSDSMVLGLVKFSKTIDFNKTEELIKKGIRSYRRLNGGISLIGIPKRVFRKEFNRIPIQFWIPYKSDLKIIDPSTDQSQRKYVLLTQGISQVVSIYSINSNTY